MPKTLLGRELDVKVSVIILLERELDAKVSVVNREAEWELLGLHIFAHLSCVIS